MTEDEIYKEAFSFCDDIEVSNLTLKSKIKSEVSKEFYDSLETCIDDVEELFPNDKIELVDTPKGQQQIEDYGLIKWVWVDQWNVGIEGDSFSGNIYVELPKEVEGKKYLRIPFSI